MALMAGPGSTSRQDGEQFEECLRRCHALEQKLTQQVAGDIVHRFHRRLIGFRNDRVSTNIELAPQNKYFLNALT